MNADRVEILSGVHRRRRYTAKQKMPFVHEAMQPGMTIPYVALRHCISPSLIFDWRRRMKEGGKEAIRADDEVVARAEVLTLQKRIRKFERVLGKKILENEILREAVKVAQKNGLRVAVVAGRGFAVKRVAETLVVSRSQLSIRMKGATKSRASYHKFEDAELQPQLRSSIDERPTYGYRRIGSLLNRERLRNGLPRLNHKRIYRLMSQNGMLLQPYTKKPPGRIHDGNIITIGRPFRGHRTALRSHAGAAMSCGSPSHSTRAIER